MLSAVFHILKVAFFEGLFVMKRSAKSRPESKTMFAVRAQRSLVMAIQSVKPTKEVQLRVHTLTAKARKAKEANFLEKYRCTNLTA